MAMAGATDKHESFRSMTEEVVLDLAEQVECFGRERGVTQEALTDLLGRVRCFVEQAEDSDHVMQSIEGSPALDFGAMRCVMKEAGEAVRGLDCIVRSAPSEEGESKPHRKRKGKRDRGQELALEKKREGTQTLSMARERFKTAEAVEGMLTCVMEARGAVEDFIRIHRKINGDFIGGLKKLECEIVGVMNRKG